MPNRVNQLLLKEYRARFQAVDSVVAIGYVGMTVNVQNKMRARLAAANLQFCFVKNRLANIAFKELGKPEIKSICQGQTALVSGEDPVAIARLLVEIAKESEDKLKLYGGMVENTVLDAKGIVELSKSATKEELKSQIVGLALSPARKLASVIIAPASKIAGQIKTHLDNLEKQSA
jgi:large subunit ribosomal protein L10